MYFRLELWQDVQQLALSGVLLVVEARVRWSFGRS